MIIRKIITYLSIVLVLTFLLRGILFRYLIAYKSVGSRTPILLVNEDLLATIDASFPSKAIDSESLVAWANKFTTEHLQFTFGRASNDPNELWMDKMANCVGYAAMLNAVLDYIITKQDLSTSIEVNHKIGELYFLGYNIHGLFGDDFFKDHDFIEIKDLIKNEKIGVDPTVSDYFWIDSISIATTP